MSAQQLRSRRSAWLTARDMDDAGREAQEHQMIPGAGGWEKEVRPNATTPVWTQVINPALVQVMPKTSHRIGVDSWRLGVAVC